MRNSHIRFVAHLDILGMSAIVEKDADQAWGMLSDLVAVRDRIGGYAMEFLDTKELVRAKDVAAAVTFSDTIILFSKGCADTELRALLILVTELLHKAMCSCVPVRVGVSRGKFFVNVEKSMYAGPALIDAYRVGESAQWLGISLAESVQAQALGLDMKSGKSKLIIEWAVPTKEGIEKRFVVNWPAVFAHDFNVKPPITVAQFYQAFEGAFGSFEKLPTKVRAKYENTVHPPYQLIALTLLKRIERAASRFPLSRLALLVESSSRADALANRYLGPFNVARIVRANGTAESPIHHYFLPKALNEPGLEIADFIMHTVGAQARARLLNSAAPTRKDFAAVIQSVPPEAVEYMSIDKVEANAA